VDLKELRVLGGDVRDHWYYASKALALGRCLNGQQPVRILDVGAGSGFFSRALLQRTLARSAVCVDPGYPDDWSETHAGKPIAFRRASPVADADLVLLMDVLEHVDDDLGLLREYAQQARTGTRFVVSVPAFSWLWSGHDEFLEHRRRYTLAQILRVVAGAGLVPVTGFYFFAVLFPALAAHRLARRLVPSTDVPQSDLRRHSPLVNSVLARICAAECTIARHNRAFGLTAFAVAEKA
jgi:SAM-dependent methyltransferase